VSDCMGIYYKYGVEFGILYDDGRYEVIYDISNFDARLLESQYYKQVTTQQIPRRQWRRFVHKHNIDISLTHSEQEHVRIYIDGKYGIKEYGFYDVCYMDTSY